MLYITCCGGVWVLEQPNSSLVMSHDRMVWLLELLSSKLDMPEPSLHILFLLLSCLGENFTCGGGSATPAKVYRQRFWMCHWKHFSPKRSKVWSISFAISALDRGKLANHQKKENKTPTTTRYMDGSGKARFKGTKALKSSQFIGCNGQPWVV